MNEEEPRDITSDELIIYLQSHPLISVEGLEKEVQAKQTGLGKKRIMPITTVQHAMKGKRGIPERHIDDVADVLELYGFKKPPTLDIPYKHIEL